MFVEGRKSRDGGRTARELSLFLANTAKISLYSFLILCCSSRARHLMVSGLIHRTVEDPPPWNSTAMQPDTPQ